ncbi:HMG box family protein [Histomonas meleagridis]|uniref:HMG box family protein n=1 Tax=Histomonas meleagridis TaxID=135588 RepID=UPI00355A5E3C|nr:HMG box family protein [Histomonas meleagridis]KAH0805519.1 HMG box family protein [Histomonas meleagridis]
MEEIGATKWTQPKQPKQPKQSVPDASTSQPCHPEQIHRPPNAFILYSQEMRSSVQQENPNLSNIEVSRLLGKMWKEVPSSSKLAYKQRAQKLQEEFKQKNPGYMYVKARRKRALNELLTKTQNYHGMMGFPFDTSPNLNQYQISCMQQLYQQQMANGYQVQGTMPQQQNQIYGYQTGQPFNMQQQYMYPQNYQMQQS